ncbi:MAG: hypothetical protein E7457_06750 [Ruminococcaceae bacterium]|nr:hypothetical protein [Oscillospiraceae bacterium]
MARTRKKQKSSSSFLTVLVLVVLLAVVGVELMNVYGKLDQARNEEQALLQQSDQQKQENASLQSSLDRADDPDFIKELAKDALGLVEEGERVFYDVNN